MYKNAIISLFVPVILFSHPGRLDSKGGHWDRRNGTYHYHSGGRAKSSDRGLNDEFLRENSKPSKLDPLKSESTPASNKPNIPAVSPITPIFDVKEWRHWVDEDGNGKNTIDEILLRSSITPITYYTNMPETQYYTNGKILFGGWVDLFTESTNTPAVNVQGMHLVPLKNAYYSGGSNWPAEKKLAYANYLEDTNHILLTTIGVSNMRGDRPPTEWMPPNKAFHKQYIIQWYTIKTNWGLSLEEGFDELSNTVFLK